MMDVRIVVPVPGVPHEIERLPDGRTALVVRTLDGGGGDAWVMGPRTRALFKTTTGVARAVIVELRPGRATALLGVPASSLVDRHVLLDELWGRAGAQLGDELVALRDPQAIVDRLARVFADRDAGSRLALEAVALLEAGEDRIAALADRLAVTARHLRRVFVEHVGIGPKEFARCVRLKRAVASTAADWGRVAASAGYYDQAHMIAEFRDLVGVTPSAYANRAITRADRRAAAPSARSRAPRECAVHP